MVPPMGCISTFTFPLMPIFTRFTAERGHRLCLSGVTL